MWIWSQVIQLLARPTYGNGKGIGAQPASPKPPDRPACVGVEAVTDVPLAEVISGSEVRLPYVGNGRDIRSARIYGGGGVSDCRFL